MTRFCYCSKVLPGKADVIRECWKNPKKDTDEDAAFWQQLGLTGFDAWLQPTRDSDFMIHSLEGKSLDTIFSQLQRLIAEKNNAAVKLWSYYKEVLGKDYSLPSAKPTLECLLDISLPSTTQVVKKAFMYPLLPEKVEEHRQFQKHTPSKETFMRSFGLSRLTVWLQTGPYYSIVYTERKPNNEQDPLKRLAAGSTPEWEEMAALLQEHTGLSYRELSPNVEWLTA